MSKYVSVSELLRIFHVYQFRNRRSRAEISCEYVAIMWKKCCVGCVLVNVVEYNSGLLQSE